MSGVSIVYRMLSGNANLIAEVPVVRIIAGEAPVGIILPAIGITEVSGFDRNTVSQAEGKRLVTERVRVNLTAKTYPTQKSIHELIRLAMRNYRGTLGSYEVDSILPDSRGPDFQDTTATMFSQYRDYIVKYLVTGAG